MKQKSRVKWIQLGDSNTKYFSAKVKERRHKNRLQRSHLLGVTNSLILKISRKRLCNSIRDYWVLLLWSYLL